MSRVIEVKVKKHITTDRDFRMSREYDLADFKHLLNNSCSGKPCTDRGKTLDRCKPYLRKFAIDHWYRSVQKNATNIRSNPKNKKSVEMQLY
jgi:hypothetical protein